MAINGNTMAVDPSTGFLTHTAHYSLTGFTAQNKLKILELLQEKFNISAACKAVGVSRTGLYLAADADPEFKTRLDAIMEAFVDRAESTLFDRAKEPNGTADRIFLLKSRRKSVYGERISVQTDQPGLLEALAKRISKYDRVIDAKMVSEASESEPKNET